MTVADEGTGQVVEGSEDIMVPPAKQTAKRGKPRKGKAGDSGQVGSVLKTVYQQTIEEDIPAEMLDLLRQLD